MAECCTEANLGSVEVDPNAGDGETYRQCIVCGRRKFTLTLDPMDLRYEQPQPHQGGEP